MEHITIKPAKNGWIIKVGCSTFVSTDKDGMLHEIGRYIDDPDKVEKEYSERAVNSPSSREAQPTASAPSDEDESPPEVGREPRTQEADSAL